MQCERCWSDDHVRASGDGPALCGPCRAGRPKDSLLLESLYLPFASKKELLKHYRATDGASALTRWAADHGLSLRDAVKRLHEEPGAMALFGREAVQRMQPRRRTAPYGYARREGALVPAVEEARVISESFRMYSGGMSLRRIADALNRREVPTSRGGRWRASTIHHILRNPLYIGCRRWNGRTMDGGPPALVDRGLFEAAQKELTRRAKRAQRPIEKAPSAATL